MSTIQIARRILASGDMLTGTNAELRAILEAYVDLTSRAERADSRVAHLCDIALQDAQVEIEPGVWDYDSAKFAASLAGNGYVVVPLAADRRSLADWLEQWAAFIHDFRQDHQHPYAPTPEQFRRWAEAIR